LQCALCADLLFRWHPLGNGSEFLGPLPFALL
jgi:hypothetical protein